MKTGVMLLASKIVIVTFYVRITVLKYHINK